MIIPEYYRDRVKRIFGEAGEYFEEIESLNYPKMPLHGDLHHPHILRGTGDGWKAIDPRE